MSDVVDMGAPKEAPEVMRGKILALEETILKLPQIDIPIRHYFAPGLYLREMRMPAGAIITGKIHKTEHYCILSQGSVTLVTENGREQVSAPAVIHSTPGAKRAIHAHRDTVWVNVHHNPTDERDLDKIDDIFVSDTYEQFLSFKESKLIQGGK
jgi:hypothetical protein